MEGLEKGVRTLCEVDKMPCHTNGPADGTVCRIKVYHLFSSPASDDIERRNNRFPRVGNQNKVGIKLFTCYSFSHFPFCIGDCACSLGLKTVTNPMIIYFKNVFVSVYVRLTCLVPVESRRGCQIHQDWSCR